MRASEDRATTAAAALVAVALFVPLLFPLATGRVFSMLDLADFHLPVRYLYQSALVEGHSLLWTDRMFGGFYLHAEGQVGAFHPVHLLLYRTLPLTIAFNLEVIASYVFAFAGMLLLLRRLGLPSAAGLVGAITFAFSGFNLLHLVHMNAVAVVAHVPWLLFTLEGILFGDQRRQARCAPGFTVLTASMLLLGYPQYVWMAALICAIYVLVQWRRLTVWAFGVAAFSAIAGVMMGGVQLLPTLDLLQRSSRHDFGPDFALTYSLHPANLLQLFSPYVLDGLVHAEPEPRFVHEFGIYNGAFCTLALLWAVARWRRAAHNHTIRFAVVLAVVGTLFALGRYGGIYEWMAVVPLVGQFRAPARHIVLLHLGLSLLAAAFFAEVCHPADGTGRRGTTWIKVAALGTAAATLIAWSWSSGADISGRQHVDFTGALIGGSIFVLAGVLVADAMRGSKLASTGLLLLIGVDAGLWGYGYVLSGGIESLSELTRRAEAPPGVAGDATIHGLGSRSPNLAILAGFSAVRAYAGLYPDRELSFRNDGELRLAGVEWVQADSGWRRIPEPMPRLRMIPDAEGAAVDLVSDEPGTIVAAIHAPRPSLLASTVAYHDGWIARTDHGQQLPTTREHGDFLAVALPAGDYRLTLAFQPVSFRAGVAVTGAGAILTLLAVAVLWWRGSKRDAIKYDAS